MKKYGYASITFNEFKDEAVIFCTHATALQEMISALSAFNPSVKIAPWIKKPQTPVDRWINTSMVGIPTKCDYFAPTLRWLVQWLCEHGWEPMSDHPTLAQYSTSWAISFRSEIN